MEYEDRIRIATPEGVELELRLAGVGSRSIGALLDEVVRWILFGACAVLVFALDVSGGWEVTILVLLQFLLRFVYDVVFEVGASGRTPGKRLAGLRVVRTGGRPVDFVSSAIRNVLRVVDFLPLLYGLGMLVVLVTARNQRVGDLAAGTLVVRDRVPSPPQPSSPPNVPPEAIVGWDVSSVTASEIATVRQFLERRESLASSARAELAADLASRLRTRVAGAPADLGPERFLELLSAAKAVRAS